jgi:hypothetical protein
MMNRAQKQMDACRLRNKKCSCGKQERDEYLNKYKTITKGE